MIKHMLSSSIDFASLLANGAALHGNPAAKGLLLDDQISVANRIQGS
jgi:hypothetical protein